MGNTVVYHQEDFNCRARQCNKNFKKSSELATHLQKDHTPQELDQHPFNTYWKGKLDWLANQLGTNYPRQGLSLGSTHRCGLNSCTESFTYNNEQQYLGALMYHARAQHEEVSLRGFFEGASLSSMSGTSLSKRYQTRHGDGWHCHDCSDSREYEDATINQTPEGLGRHWSAKHLDGNYWCPVRGCNTQGGKREWFTGVHPLLIHIQAHKSTTLDIRPGDPDGWLKTIFSHSR